VEVEVDVEVRVDVGSDPLLRVTTGRNFRCTGGWYERGGSM
jgi:hypothetical protein